MSMHIPLQLKILGRDTVEIQIYNHLIQPYYHVNKIKNMMIDISITPNIMSWSGMRVLKNAPVSSMNFVMFLKMNMILGMHHILKTRMEKVRRLQQWFYTKMKKNATHVLYTYILWYIITIPKRLN